MSPFLIMIIIISSGYDNAVNEVSRYLISVGRNVTIIDALNNECRLEELNVLSGEFRLKYNNSPIDSRDISAVWFRKGNILSLPITEKDYNKDQVKFCLREQMVVEKHLWNLDLPKLGNKFSSIPNKLDVLKRCNALEIPVPETHVVSNKPNLIEILSKGKYIYKPLSDPIKTTGEIWMKMHSKLFTESDIKKIPDNFQPLLIQKYIKSKIEIRSVFFENKFYCCGFDRSHADNVDIRLKGYKGSYFNIDLPKSLKSKIISLLTELVIDFCSLDIIYDGQIFYLLDVNPSGQFGFISKYGNYNLEEKIANYLINE